MNDKTRTYVAMLRDILNQKKNLMEEILEVTRSQHDIITNAQDVDQFDESLNVKEKLLEKIAELDKGFNDAYAKVSADLAENKLMFKPDIQSMQEQIKGLTGIGVRIQALEEQNRIAFEQYMTEKRRTIKEFKVSNQAVSNYYKNMTGKPQGEAYFMDKKK